MPPEEFIEKVKEWIELADEDLMFAQHGLTIEKKTPLQSALDILMKIK